MTPDSLLGQDWLTLIERLGGASELETTARASKALLRRREVASAADLLRLVLAYCLGDRGLRLTSAWASAVGLADLSNPALLKRLRQCGDWLALLVGRTLARNTALPSHGRLVRIVDATVVTQAGTQARRSNKLWRIHSAFDLPSERFTHFELTDEHGGETLDRIAVVPGEIRLGDRVYLQTERIARVLEAGGDIVVRASWNNASWRDRQGAPVKLAAVLAAAAAHGVIDQPIWLARPGAQQPLALRLVGVRKPPEASAAARSKARLQARKEGRRIAPATLAAAEWVLLVTSLSQAEFAAEQVLALYRLRWRIELGFKRLKSIIGLKTPPGCDPRSAKPYVLAHLLAILLLEPMVDELEDSPRWAVA